MTLKLYTCFHLNMAYSAIEEEDRPTVIEKCYWPLLKLVRCRELPLGIELSGYSLETIQKLDSRWVNELRHLVNKGLCELVGSGYSQVIGPLVPPEVTAANLRLGMQSYESFLGCRPKVALLNEQAYASSLVPLYRDAGYEALIMEWNNPKREHDDWNPEWRYLPQYARGPMDESLGLIWNKSVAFQKFQRYVHAEIELDEYIDYLYGHFSENERAFPLYANDVEIFDYRPGRYMTESPIHEAGEWERIEKLFEVLENEINVEFIPPSQVLDLGSSPEAGNLLQLESARQPVPVKKQGKYNLLRWAVTGRNDLYVNTTCWKLFNVLNNSIDTTDSDWRELCYLWGSDFRTHITQARWEKYLNRLRDFSMSRLKNDTDGDRYTKSSDKIREVSTMHVERNGRFLQIDGERVSVRFNCLRGLALDVFVDRNYDDRPFCGTLHHGYFDDIRWSADYYSGHLVFESPGRPKITDLNRVEPEITHTDRGIRVSGLVPTQLGPVEKTWCVDDTTGRVLLSVSIHWEEAVIGSLRVGHVTLIPGTFDKGSLYYETHNGGQKPEQFALTNSDVDHRSAVSFLVSASHAIGLTGGELRLGDKRHHIKTYCDKTQAALVGLITHYSFDNTHFTRLSLSAREVDDTSHPSPIGPAHMDFELSVGEN